jgi:hypothetical protein
MAKENAETTVPFKWSFKKNSNKDQHWIPEKVHNAITVTIKQMIRSVLFGAKHATLMFR